MAAHEQYYLTCDKCGATLHDGVFPIKGETEDCVRSEAEDFRVELLQREHEAG